MRFILLGHDDCVLFPSKAHTLHPVEGWHKEALASLQSYRKDLGLLEEGVFGLVNSLEKVDWCLHRAQLFQDSGVDVLFVDWRDETELFLAFDDTEVALTVPDIRLPTLEARPNCYPSEARPHNLCDELRSDDIIDQSFAY